MQGGAVWPDCRYRTARTSELGPARPAHGVCWRWQHPQHCCRHHRSVVRDDSSTSTLVYTLISTLIPFFTSSAFSLPFKPSPQFLPSLHLSLPSTCIHLSPLSASLHLSLPSTSLHLFLLSTCLHLSLPSTSLHLSLPSTTILFSPYLSSLLSSHCLSPLTPYLSLLLSISQFPSTRSVCPLILQLLSLYIPACIVP